MSQNEHWHKKNYWLFFFGLVVNILGGFVNSDQLLQAPMLEIRNLKILNSGSDFRDGLSALLPVANG